MIPSQVPWKKRVVAVKMGVAAATRRVATVGRLERVGAAEEQPGEEAEG
jgi:hypothetical protein